MRAPATTETRTEYGVKYPDGSIDWRTELDGVNLSAIAANQRVQTGYGSESAVEVTRKKLTAKAELLHIDPAEFVKGHAIVSREIITVTMAHETAVKLEFPAHVPF